MHNFAVSLLVEENLYSEVSQFVNSTNLRGRLVYHRVDTHPGSISKNAPANSLFHKLNIQPNSYTEWLETELKLRFDYACVDSIQVFRNSERAVTITGQIRHNRTRHEKNDRYDIDDSSQWVLGFDNKEKLELFKNRAQKLAKEINELAKRLEALTADDNRQADRIRSCQTLVDVQWQEINSKPVIERISNIERALEEARKGNKDLNRIAQQIEEQKKVVEKAQSEWMALRNEIYLVQKTLKGLNDSLEKALQNPARLAVTTYQQEGLSQRFDILEQPMSLENLDEQVRRVEKALNEEIKSLDIEENKLIRAIEESFAEFKRRWALESADMDSTVASVSDFLNKLQRLETDGLPAYEQRFFGLLQTQSQENLTILSQYLVLERRAILEGMAKVNESLRQAPFNPGTHLQIKVDDLQLSDVLEFRNNIQEALSNAFTEDRENAEARFIILSNIVKRLSSKAPEDRNWRELVLDVRLHVEFIGQELSENGEIKNIYRSGAGKSGGQREKLTTTCLAAALRFQLCGNNDGLPTYAPVVLDEAFSKADHLFTTSAMNIFRTFGFQMIVATPYRAVRTFEPFIGGACVVHINAEQNLSSVLPIVYDETSQRLNFEKTINEQDLVEAS